MRGVPSPRHVGRSGLGGMSQRRVSAVRRAGSTTGDAVDERLGCACCSRHRRARRMPRRSAASVSRCARRSRARCRAGCGGWTPRRGSCGWRWSCRRSGRPETPPTRHGNAYYLSAATAKLPIPFINPQETEIRKADFITGSSVSSRTPGAGTGTGLGCSKASQEYCTKWHLIISSFS